MLPPDEGNKNSGRWNMLKTAFTKIASFFDENLYRKYFKSTIKAMFYEIETTIHGESNKLSGLRNTFSYFESVFTNLSSFYLCCEPSLAEELKMVFIIFLM